MMKKMKIKKYIVFSLILIFGIAPALLASTFPTDDTKLTKTITRSFKIPKDGHVSIINKYGPVVINTWNKDSVHVKIEITAFGKNDKSVSKIMDRVDFDFDLNSKYLLAATVLDRSSGFFTELWNNLGDYSKTLLSQNQLKIEYTVYLPASIDLDIDNKFGDIYLEDFKGDLNIELSHGNFRGGNFLGRLDLDLSFGNAEIKSANEADLTLKATESDFNQINKATIHSSSSEIFITKIGILRLDSRSDRKFYVKNANSISGSSSFSKIQLDNFKEDLKLELNFGSFRINMLEPGFSSIDLQGKTAEINLDFTEGNYLDFEYVGDENKLFISKGGDKLSKEFVDSKEKTVKVTGMIGKKGSSAPSKVILNTESGEVNIKID
jgi:hypothetical protein